MNRRKLLPIGKEPCEKCNNKIVIISDYHPLCAKHYIEYLDIEHVKLLLKDINDGEEFIYKGAREDILTEIKKQHPELFN